MPKVRFYFKEYKVDKSKGWVYVLLQDKGKRVAFSTGVSIEKELWDDKKQVVVHEKYKALNQAFIEIKDEFVSLYLKEKYSGIVPDLGRIKRHLLRNILGLEQRPAYIEELVHARENTRDLKTAYIHHLLRKEGYPKAVIKELSDLEKIKRLHVLTKRLLNVSN